MGPCTTVLTTGSRRTRSCDFHRLLKTCSVVSYKWRNSKHPSIEAIIRTSSLGFEASSSIVFFGLLDGVSISGDFLLFLLIRLVGVGSRSCVEQIFKFHFRCQRCSRVPHKSGKDIFYQNNDWTTTLPPFSLETSGFNIFCVAPQITSIPSPWFGQAKTWNFNFFPFKSIIPLFLSPFPLP